MSDDRCGDDEDGEPGEERKSPAVRGVPVLAEDGMEDVAWGLEPLDADFSASSPLGGTVTKGESTGRGLTWETLEESVD